MLLDVLSSYVEDTEEAIELDPPADGRHLPEARAMLAEVEARIAAAAESPYERALRAVADAGRAVASDAERADGDRHHVVGPGNYIVSAEAMEELFVAVKAWRDASEAGRHGRRVPR
jgi:hypothetical protein